jgi:hypothetical protein
VPCLACRQRACVTVSGRPFGTAAEIVEFVGQEKRGRVTELRGGERDEAKKQNL